MRILITGGAGFQGSHLAEGCLRQGHEVSILNTFSQRSLDNVSKLLKDANIVWGSITDPEIVEKTVRQQDVVIHMAARINVDESIQNPLSFLAANVTGTCNMLEAVRKFGSRMIHASSTEVYGSAGGGAIKETSEMRPYSPYAASKSAADRFCFSYVKTYDIDVTIVRPCNLFGPRQKSGAGGAVIPIFVDRASSGQPLTVFGSGEQRREYMHVDDLVDAYLFVLGRDDLKGEALNFGTGETPSIKEIAHFVAGKFDSKVEHGPGRLGEIDVMKLDSSKAKGLGFMPKVHFWDGLDRYIQWRQNTEPAPSFSG